MFNPGIEPNQGLLLVQPGLSRVNSAIHMLFMRFNLAAIWIDTDLKVVDRRLAKPWNPIIIPIRSARYILETHSSRLNEFQIGEQLTFQALSE